MNKRRSILNRARSVLLAAGLAAALASTAAAQTEFTYQGVLSDGSGPVTGTENIRFRLYDAPVGGTLFGETTQNVDVADGVFTAPLNLGTLHTIDPASAWIEIAVGIGGGFFDTLGRQKITAAPFAMNTRGIEVAPDNVVSMSPHLRIDGTLDVFPLADGGSFKVVDFPPAAGIAEGTAVLGVYNGESEGPQQRFESDDPDYIFWDIGQNAEKGFAVELYDEPVMTLSLDRRVGIGTTAPAGPFHVQSPAGGVPAFIVGETGNVGIGLNTNSLAGALNVNGDSYLLGDVVVTGQTHSDSLSSDTYRVGDNFAGQARIRFDSAFNSVPRWEFMMDDVDNDALQLNNLTTQGLPVMEIDNGTGHIGINGFAPADYTVAVNGEVCATAFLCASSRALKDDITPIESALALVDRLEGVTYTWNESAPEDMRGQHAIGFIAEDVAEVLPTIVATDDAGNAISIDYAKMTPVAIQAIKELKARYGDELAELRADNDALRVRLERLELMLDTYARNTD